MYCHPCKTTLRVISTDIELHIKSLVRRLAKTYFPGKYSDTVSLTPVIGFIL